MLHQQGRSMTGCLTFVCLCVALTLGAQTARANFITNGGFETGDFTGWTVNALEKEVRAENEVFWAHGGTYYAMLRTMDLRFYNFTTGAYTGPLGALSQTVTTTPGQALVLSYWLTGHTWPSEISVSWNGVQVPGSVVMHGPQVQSPHYTNYQFVVKATGSDVLAFNFWGGTHIIDDIALTAAVPEPHGAALLIVAILGFAVTRRNHHHRAGAL
jgi:hypothetical protein